MKDEKPKNQEEFKEPVLNDAEGGGGDDRRSPPPDIVIEN